MAHGIASVPKVRKVSSVAKAPLETRKFPVLEVGKKGDRERLEEMAATAYLGTLPERLVYAWVDKQRVTWYRQKRIYSSYTQYLSTIVDVLILNYPGIAKPLILRIQGQYWHLGTRAGKDDILCRRLEASGYRVRDLWEADIYRAALDNRLHTYIDNTIRDPAVW